MDELEKVICPNLSFTIENKMGNLRGAGHMSNFYSNFKNFSMNWDKYVFHWEKWVFGWNWLTYWEFCTYRQRFGLRNDPANTLTPLSSNAKNANINSKEVTIHKYRKSVATEKSILFKSVADVLKLWIQHDIQNVIYLFRLTFHLTDVHFRGELQPVGDVSEQKFKYGPIRTREITDIRLLQELYVKFLI